MFCCPAIMHRDDSVSQITYVTGARLAPCQDPRRNPPAIYGLASRAANTRRCYMPNQAQLDHRGQFIEAVSGPLINFAVQLFD